MFTLFPAVLFKVKIVIKIIVFNKLQKTYLNSVFQQNGKQSKAFSGIEITETTQLQLVQTRTSKPSLFYFKNLTSLSTVCLLTATILTSRPLDRETLDVYELALKAVYPHGGQSCSVHVTIRIGDVNDNHPHIITRGGAIVSGSAMNENHIKVSVREDVGVGSVVYRVMARDIDAGGVLRD